MTQATRLFFMLLAAPFVLVGLVGFVIIGGTIVFMSRLSQGADELCKLLGVRW